MLKDFLQRHSGFLTIIIIPVVIVFIVLYICKSYNFSIFPKGLQGKKPSKFKFPTLKRKIGKNCYKWEATQDSSSEEEDSEEEQ